MKENECPCCGELSVQIIGTDFPRFGCTNSLCDVSTFRKRTGLKPTTRSEQPIDCALGASEVKEAK